MQDLELLPLVISVKVETWRMDDSESSAADRGFEQIKRGVRERDGHACRFCGVKAMRWQEVHHINDDHHDNRPENLATACLFCHGVHHIGLAGQREEAVLAWLPELSQQEVIHLCRTKMIAKAWGGKPEARDPVNAHYARMLGDVGKAMDDSLRLRTKAVHDRFGTANPLLLGNALLALHGQDPERYADRARRLAGLRFVPLGRRVVRGKDVMPEIVAAWMETGGSYAALQPSTWARVMRQYTARSQGRP